MRRLGFLLAALAFLATPAAAQPARSLAGEWRGHYVQGGAETPFEATFEQDGRFFTGIITETARLGGGEGVNLRATVTGRIKGDRIEWTKTYDGTGGQSHSVRYVGNFAGADRVAGVWRIDWMSDTFRMQRQ